MFKKIKAKSVEEYLESVSDPRKKDILFLHDFIQKAAPQLRVHLAYNMLGYGSFPYKNYKKELIEWPTVALAEQKNYISIYICSIEDKKYLAEKYKEQLGKVSVGKSCIRFKKVSDLNLDTLKAIILKASENPGLTI